MADGIVMVGGVQYDITVTPHIPVPPPPPPVEKPTVVTIGQASQKLDGVNPTSNVYPGGRGIDQLILYRAPVTKTVTNTYGCEVQVLPSGTVLAVNDRLTTGSLTGTVVPLGGSVLSGHGAARTWLLANAKVGVKATLTNVPIPSPPPPVAGTGNISTWVMLWDSSPKVDIGALPEEIDEVRLAFINGTGQIVGAGPYGLAALRAQLQTFLSVRAGRFVSASLGGGGYDVDLSSVSGWVAALKAREVELGVTWGGMNVDVETSSFKQQASSYVALARQFKAERPGFYCSWSPNGTYKWDYRDVLQAAPDVVDELAFQNYDTLVSYETAAGIVSSFLGGGKLAASQIGIGQMIGIGSNYWTLAQCVDYSTRLRDQFGVTKTNYWEASRPPLAEWATAMKKISQQ